MCLLAGAAQAQMALPGAEAPAADAPSARTTLDKRSSPEKKPSKASPRTPVASSIIDRPLMLNGRDGELRLSGGPDGKGKAQDKDKSLRIDKFTLLGEVISDPKQRCQIDIVAQTPIEAVHQGAPEGLDRYSANIPACPLAFDVLEGAVLVPAQTAACVFQAADCQASPSGLWGPDGASASKDDKAIAKQRSHAVASIETSLKALEKKDKSAAEILTREQNDFAAQREDTCRDYAGEAQHAYCATRLTQARAVALRRHVAKAKSKDGEDE